MSSRISIDQSRHKNTGSRSQPQHLRCLLPCGSVINKTAARLINQPHNVCSASAMRSCHHFSITFRLHRTPACVDRPLRADDLASGHMRTQRKTHPFQRHRLHSIPSQPRLIVTLRCKLAFHMAPSGEKCALRLGVSLVKMKSRPDHTGQTDQDQPAFAT